MPKFKCEGCNIIYKIMKLLEKTKDDDFFMDSFINHLNEDNVFGEQCEHFYHRENERNAYYEKERIENMSPEARKKQDERVKKLKENDDYESDLDESDFDCYMNNYFSTKIE